MRLIAVLPMRGGSQRVPRKNLRDLGGVPLFVHALKTLQSLSIFEEVVVDSDSDEILNAVSKYLTEKTVLSKRPPELGLGSTPMTEVLSRLGDKFEPDWIFQTHSTSPFLNAKTIENFINRVFSEGYDSGFSVSALQARLWDSNSMPLNHSPGELKPTQELEKIFVENSAFYFFRPNQLTKRKTRFGLNPLMFELSRIESIDIDEEDDFSLAEAVIEGIKNDY